MDHLRSEVRDQPGQYGETLFLLKNKKDYPGVVAHTCKSVTGEAEAGEFLETVKWTFQ